MPDPFVDTVSDLEEQARERADLDWSSPFHTIGKGPTQAAAGNHKHDESVDPVLVNWFHHGVEGWVKYNGTGTMVWKEMNSPSMPGVLECNGEVWAEWQMAGPQVFEPEALYKMTVRARLDAVATLSFGFQCYDADTPPVVVDNVNGPSLLKPHYAGVNIVAGDAAYIDEARPGEWLAWTGYISEKSNGDAENIPLDNTTAPVEASVLVASGVSQWRPMFYSTGRVWVDAVEVRRLETSVQAPGDIYITNIESTTIVTEVIETTDFRMPPSTEGYVLTAVDESGNSEWQYPPITVSEGPPTNPNMLTPDQIACRGGWTGSFPLVYNGDGSMTQTMTTTPVTGVWTVPNPYLTAVTPGKSYTVQAHLTPTGRPASVRMIIRDAANVYLADSGVLSSPIQPGSSGLSTVTLVAPANATNAVIYMNYSGVGTVGDTVTIRNPGLWEGTNPYPDAPENPLTVNLGTLYGRHAGMTAVNSSIMTITSTTPGTRCPGSKSLQWEQVVPAMVKVRFTGYLYQSASTTAILYCNVGVADENGTKLMTDDYTGPTTAGYLGGSILYGNASGRMYVPIHAIWQRYLPPGTYTAYPAAWVDAVDAASSKGISYGYLTFEIDPEMTYLPGMRS